MKKKILFIVPHRPGRSPGQRFRFEQYLSFLRENGFECEASYIITEADDQLLYKKGHYFEKFKIHRRAIKKRELDVARANDFDIIFIFREALVTGSVKFEELFRKSKAKIVFDFDDAIWHLDVSEANRMLGWLKKPGKTASIIKLSNLVIAGNNYLATYARKNNPNVEIIPTTIDTVNYQLVEGLRHEEKIVIGWSGSITTIKHFELAIPFLEILKKKYDKKIEFRVLGDPAYVNEKLGIKGIRWTQETEVRELSYFDIGIMPLPDDEWAKGKCGCKGLQYMAIGIPTLMSPVGVNSDIVENGVNGFLPSTTEEWLLRIEELIASPELRKRIGDAGKKTVEEKYSVNAWKEKYLGLFEQLLK
ncbi:MAG: glycosyltransferase family 4 protein [Bacteroidetes bacterium]|nr:glycosyltransferase family 4 protein [Bacteroidota bacterium]